MKTTKTKPSAGLAVIVLNIAAKFLSQHFFHPEVIRNELAEVKGPFVLICNHECALDAILIFRLCRQSATFVMSDQFYFTVPFRKLLNKLNVIHKMQFKTKLSDMKKMKDAVDKDDGGLIIFPAGLMCADGRSLPIPKATGQFLQFLGVPVYAGRIYGSYFAQPKWSGRMRPGKTRIDIYRLFSAEELKQAPVDAVDRKICQALAFDAYREQEHFRIRYKNADDIEGLENVLYRCPNCRQSYTIQVRNRHTIHCVNCGYTEQADEYGFLHLIGDTGKEIRYVSDWSRQIHQDVKDEIQKDMTFALSTAADIQILNRDAGCFESIGHGNVTMDKEHFTIQSIPEGNFFIKVSTAGMPSLPFKPGLCFDIQDGNEIYRCFPKQGRTSVQFVHMTEILYDL